MNDRICSVMQPTFLPWIGYFDLIDAADTFVLYDDVQFTKQSWQCRNRIKTANGVIWLTVPLKKHVLAAKINQIEINNSKPWVAKLLKTLFYTYNKTPYFHETYSFLEGIFKDKEFQLLSELTIEIIRQIVNRLGITTNILLSSTLNGIGDDRDGKLVNICQKLECDNYLSAKGSSIYIETEQTGGVFSNYNINLRYQNYTHPEYMQKYGEFEPYMSIIDLFFYEGFKNSIEIIRRGRELHLTPV